MISDIKVVVVFKMLLIIFSNAYLWFTHKVLFWGSYNITTTLLTIQKIEIIDKKEFVVIILDKEDETFMVYIVATSVKVVLNIYFS